MMVMVKVVKIEFLKALFLDGLGSSVDMYFVPGVEFYVCPAEREHRTSTEYKFLSLQTRDILLHSTVYVLQEIANNLQLRGHH